MAKRSSGARGPGARAERANGMVLVGGDRPKLKRRSGRDWTRAKEQSFLTALAETCNVTRAGKAGSLAAYTRGGWRTMAAVEGMAVFVRSLGIFAIYRAGAWEMGQVRCSSVLVEGKQVVGSQAEAIFPPSGGRTVDAEARAAVTEIPSALRGHGLIRT